MHFVIIVDSIEADPLDSITLTRINRQSTDRPTENFWSLVLNSGEKFSTNDYKKKGNGWTNYASKVTKGDVIYLVYGEKDVQFLINRKCYGQAFLLPKKEVHYLYCLTHDDSTVIEIKSMKMLKVQTE